MTKIDIAKKLKDKRKQLGLSQRQCAALFNSTPPWNITTTRRSISKYETGATACPTVKYLKFMDLPARKE